MRDSIPRWQDILLKGFSSAAELLEFLQLPNEDGTALAEKTFKTRVPRGFAARMEPKNRLDPLLLQVLASQDELEVTSDFSYDPLDEMNSNPIQGLIHKYHGRVLLTVTGTCAVNCRYCFRRYFPYQENNPGRQGWQSAIEYIAQDPTIHEVILSGGEPLLASDSTLSYLFDQLSLITHVKIIRIHTRIPVVLPERIQGDLLTILNNSRFQIVIVLHSNHPNELNDEVAAACAALRQANCYLLNQAVLLKGVNNHVDVLAALSERLFACGVLPYYLHLLDKVQGTQHFDIPSHEARAIFATLQARLPGYLVPRLVREEAGGKNKTLCS
ncbi:MAG: EF-P beta-lysylation protein EpmB [Legionellaceae bacterium]|nr:EF-P beta-lysylation protein EpmB [Legionellaceae bacterium]